MFQIRRIVTGVVGVSVIFASSAFADPSDTTNFVFDSPPLDVPANDVPVMQIMVAPSGQPAGGAPRGTCPPQSQTYSDLPFTGEVQVTLPPGMVAQEIAAATYTVPVGNWPIIVRTGEILWGQNHFNSTTTAFTLLVWQGEPNTGTLVASYSSDGDLIPHVTLPFAGAQVVDLQVTVDPQDAEQIIVQNDGSNKFTVGFRIDQHNNPPTTSCTAPCSGLGSLPSVCCPPDTNTNAWPAMDSAGPGPNGSQQWLFARDCPGATGLCSLAVHSGWTRLNNESVLPADYVNDWTIRAIYEPLNCILPDGACCKSDGSCEELPQSACTGIGGLYQGDETLCANVSCPQPTGACCFMPSGCVNLTAADCSGAMGTWSGSGSSCATVICFPTGVCCMPDGSCLDAVRDTNCDNMGGTFLGDGTVCSGISCPQPFGACCQPSFCLNLIETDCEQIPNAQWMGMGTDCVDANMNSIADDCEGGNPCDGVLLGDFDGSTTVDGADVQGFISALLSASPSQGEICTGDFNTSGGLDIGDVSGLVAAMLN